MAVKARNNSAAPSFVDGYFRALSSQSILDVFVVQGLILPADAAKISAKYQNNLAIERFLLSNNLISREAINKAYSIILKLPFVSLTKLQIPKEALNVIPEKTAKKFNIVPFGVKANNIQIAVGNPGDIFLLQNRNFDAIEIQGGLKLEFFISTPEDVSKAIEQYSQKSSEILLSKTSVPVIFLRNRDIPIKYLKMLPVDFVKKNRVVIFDHVSDKIYRIAEETYDDSKTKKIIEFLKKNNGIELEEFSTSKEDIDYLVQIYENTLVKEAKIASDEKVIENKEELSQKPDIKDHLKGMDVGDLEEDQPEITISEIKSKDGGKSEKVDLKSLVSEDDIQKGDTNTLNNVQSDIEKKQANGDDKVLSQESQGIESQELEDDKAMEVKHELDQIRKNEEDEKNIGKLLGDKEIKSKSELEAISKENSVPKLVAAIISYSLFMHSSDIHIEPEAKK